MAKRNTGNSYPLIDNNCTGRISVTVLELWHLLKACNILNVNCDWAWSILVLHIVAFYTHQPCGKCTSARSRLQKDCRSQDRQEQPNSLNKRDLCYGHWWLLLITKVQAIWSALLQPLLPLLQTLPSPAEATSKGFKKLAFVFGSCFSPFIFSFFSFWEPDI